MRRQARPRYDFRVGVPDVGALPVRHVAPAGRPASCDAPRSTIRHYADPAGHAGLRAAIARQSACPVRSGPSADDIIVTQGAQQALDLVGRVLIEPGDCVAVEDPGYPEARAAVPVARRPRRRRTGRRRRHRWSRRCRTAGPAGLRHPVAPVPARHCRCPWPRRAALLALGRARTTRSSSRTTTTASSVSPTVRSSRCRAIDRGGRVVYVGTFSKTLLPMLRLGYLVAPSTLQPALRTAKRLADWHGSLPIQAALARFIERACWAGTSARRPASTPSGTSCSSRVARDFDDWFEPWDRRLGCTWSRCSAGPHSATMAAGPSPGRGRAAVGLLLRAEPGPARRARPRFRRIATDDIDPALHHLAIGFAT